MSQGAENVKEFLTKKVKDMEDSAKSVELDAALVAQQTSADQEVISFLDARVRELEKGSEELEGKTAKAEAGLNKVKEERKKQLKVLEDMLQFERQNLKSKVRVYIYGTWPNVMNNYFLVANTALTSLSRRRRASSSRPRSSL